MAAQHVGGANTGWWPLLWFIAKVWTFLFVFMWLRATLPRLRYDQFMALGWKILIPVSLVWIMIVATLRTLRQQGYHSWAIALLVAGTVAGSLCWSCSRKPAAARGSGHDRAGSRRRRGHRASRCRRCRSGKENADA